MANKAYVALDKVLLLGDSNVSKTCLVSQFCEKKCTDKFTATIGLHFQVQALTVEGKMVRLQIWDTAGQERFNNIIQRYYRDSKGLMLVYDITNRSSFENVSKWLNDFKEQLGDKAGETVKMLTGNKSDLENEREVSTEEGEALAKEKDIGLFKETSAKENVTVENVFEALAKELLKNSGQELEEPPNNLILGRQDSTAIKCCCSK